MRFLDGATPLGARCSKNFVTRRMTDDRQGANPRPDNVDVMMVLASPDGLALTRGHDDWVHEPVGSILPLNLSDTVPRCATLTHSVASRCFRQVVRLEE
jgi:hypothetical protein